MKKIDKEISEISQRLHKWRSFLFPESKVLSSYSESGLYHGYLIFCIHIAEDVMGITSKLYIYPKGEDFLKLIKGEDPTRFVFPTPSMKEIFMDVCEEDLENLKNLYKNQLKDIL